ncbi:MAG: PhzF family phenazine biosynthesis protein [Thermoplasmata archaeon]
MRVAIYQVDAFTTRRFAGNPAAVMLLDQYLPDAHLQAVAAENNLAETAFLVKSGTDYRLRWFTPTTEVPLCGHGTLASAAVVMERLEPSRSRVVFDTASGPLSVTRSDGKYLMDFPARTSRPIPPPIGLTEALGMTPAQVTENEFNFLALLDGPRTLRGLRPDFAAIARLDRPGVIVTARGDEGYDFISRYFAPAKGIPEDPVTGAAHCMLAPFWAARLQKTSFRAFQASPRGGEVVLRLRGDRVDLEGECVFYLEGTAEI